ncbi:fatty acyl-AMP ligase [Paenibacillus xylaniclasticus]|uniref:fatty acyl-AMP ligase n=1 Tax=Paenibacillus xylaniclasticus TaxID=588083 RepID=UPI000FDC9BCB|nr:MULTISPECIES: fatty acyl-AMP ligase [Paenibacillus]GFN33270.1 acyl-CoA synthetase [Paenibacillus curdlanolyticus]
MMKTGAMFQHLVDLLEYRAWSQPDLVLYTFLADGERIEHKLTAAELRERAVATAAALQQIGSPGEPVLLLYPPGIEFLVGFMGCAYADMIAVPVYPPHLRKPTPRLAAISKDTGAKIALSTHKLCEDVREAALQGDHLSYLNGLRWLAADKLPEGLTWNPPAIDGNGVMFLQYTSGSTSTPKGVIVSHQNLLFNMSMMAKYFQLSPQTRGVSWLPAHHDMGLIGKLLTALHTGYSLTFMSPVSFMQKPLRWLQAISRTRGTYSGAPNFAYELCVAKFKEEAAEGLDLSSWETAFNGAEPVRNQTLERFAACYAPYGFQAKSLVPAYGLAEATLFVTGCRRDSAAWRTITVDSRSVQASEVELTEPDAEYAQTMVACGSIPPEQKLAIVDPATSNRLADGTIGEIWLHGASVAKGYWGKSQESSQSFEARIAGEGDTKYLRTGDLGFTLDGELYIAGRMKDVIIIRGCNHYPQDIELTAQQAHPAVKEDCIAAFVEQRDGDERLVIVAEINREYRVRGRQGENGAAEIKRLVAEVSAAVRQAVSNEHELTVHSVVLIRVGTIPKTSSGKIQRQYTKQLYEQGKLETL